MRIYQGTAPDAIARESLLVEVSGKKQSEGGLDRRRRYYFELCFEGGEGDGLRFIVSLLSWHSKAPVIGVT